MHSSLYVIGSGARMEKGGGAQSNNPVKKPATLEFLAAEKSSLKKVNFPRCEDRFFQGEFATGTQ
jgi:hypothetical protein